jgi:hypothetical protein
VSVDTKKLRNLADVLEVGRDDLVGSAADELDELRAHIVTLREAQQRNVDGLVAAHEATKRELGELQKHHEEHHAREEYMRPICVTCESQPNDLGPGCDCTHAPCVHDTNRLRADLTAERARRESAEAALREYTGLDTKHAHIASAHFARYPRCKHDWYWSDRKSATACERCGKTQHQIITDLTSQLAAVTRDLEEERRKLATAVEALECITQCNSNEFSEEPDVIARQALATIRAGEEKP